MTDTIVNRAPDIAGAITELRRILRVGKVHASTRYDRVDAIEKVIRMLEGEHSAERTDDQ